MDYTEEQQSEMRSLLEKLHKETASHIEQLTESCRPVSLDESIGRLTRLDAIRQQNMAMAALRSSRQRLFLYEVALRRLDEGQFGECVSCGEPIQWERLKAKPDATLCIKCAR